MNAPDPLPVGLTPIPGETRTSYLGRLSAANYVSRHQLQVVLDAAPPEEAARICRLTDKQFQDVWGTSAATGYRPTLDWYCPKCRGCTNAVSRHWLDRRLTACTVCRTLLVVDGAYERTAIPVTTEFLTNQALISEPGPHFGQRWQAFRGHLDAIATGFDSQWPSPFGEEDSPIRHQALLDISQLDLSKEDRRTLPTPAISAFTLHAAWNHTGTPASEGHLRRGAGGVTPEMPRLCTRVAFELPFFYLDRRAPAPIPLLPRRGVEGGWYRACRPLSDATPSDWDEFHLGLQHLRSKGLTSRNIPALPAFLPEWMDDDPESWMFTRSCDYFDNAPAAVALHAVLRQLETGGKAHPYASFADLNSSAECYTLMTDCSRTPQPADDCRPCALDLLMQTVERSRPDWIRRARSCERQFRTPTWTHLLKLGRHLIEEGLADYQQRRDAFPRDCAHAWPDAAPSCNFYLSRREKQRIEATNASLAVSPRTAATGAREWLWAYITGGFHGATYVLLKKYDKALGPRREVLKAIGDERIAALEGPGPTIDLTNPEHATNHAGSLVPSRR